MPKNTKKYDFDLKLYLDIEKELRSNFKLLLQQFLQNEKIYYSNNHTPNYFTFKNIKKQQLNALLKRLMKRLNIVSIDKFLLK